MNCKICNKEVTIRQMAMHLRWDHSLKTEDYILQYGEFRDKFLKSNEKKEKSGLKCEICKEPLLHNRQLMHHLKHHPEISQEDYIIKYLYGGIKPVCKCAGHFKMLLLVFAYRNLCCTVNNDICSHKGRVSEQPCIYIVGLSADFFFKGGAAL